MGRTIFFPILFFITFSTIVYAQGQLFTKEEANQRFGSVIVSVDIPVSTIQHLIDQGNIIRLMFRIQENQAIILDDRRNVLYPSNMIVNSQDVFTVFNIEIINELLLNGTGNSIIVEKREKVLSITYDQMTMEVGTPCPPICD